MRSFLFLALAMLLSAASPSALAVESGSHGWSRAELTLRDGPGAAYNVTGHIAERSAIMVLRCQKLWCLVDGKGGRGWSSKQYVSFGLMPAHPSNAPRLHYGSGGPGSICFYEGRNFTGAELCLGHGQVFNDLARWGLDNRFSSVRLTGNVSAAACRDRFFQSYCERIVASQPVLDQYLDNNLSSIHVY